MTASTMFISDVEFTATTTDDTSVVRLPPGTYKMLDVGRTRGGFLIETTIDGIIMILFVKE